MSEKVLGIMSGTSLDGVDFAVCQISKSGIKLKDFWSVKFPKALQKNLLKAANNKLSSYEVGQLNHDLGRFYAKCISSVKFDYVGLHGQTVFHHPQKHHEATTQIGEPSYIASKTNRPVYSNFRSMDMAEGGQGAPLAPLFHLVALANSKFNVAVNNIGGISNVTYIPKGIKFNPNTKIDYRHKKIISFDTGPGNMLIDSLIKVGSKGRHSFDKNGDLAARGVSSKVLIQRWLQAPYFKMCPPKSTGRELFGDIFYQRISKDLKGAKLSFCDQVATVTEFTAATIVDSYQRFLPALPDQVVLCGGGSQNQALIKNISYLLNQCRWKKSRAASSSAVMISDDLGWPSQSIEAAAFALLAYRSKNKLAGNLFGATGARRPVVLGQCTNPAG